MAAGVGGGSKVSRGASEWGPRVRAGGVRGASRWLECGFEECGGGGGPRVRRRGGAGRKRDAEPPPDAAGAGWSRGPGGAGGAPEEPRRVAGR